MAKAAPCGPITNFALLNNSTCFKKSNDPVRRILKPLFERKSIISSLFTNLQCEYSDSDLSINIFKEFFFLLNFKNDFLCHFTIHPGIELAALKIVPLKYHGWSGIIIFVASKCLFFF